MSAAALTPRVRTILVCDAVIPSPSEVAVFTLEGVRQHLLAGFLPWRASPMIFLLLSSARKGRYTGKILVVNDRTDRCIRYVKFGAQFDHDHELLPLQVELGDCVFPEHGSYTFEVYFSSPEGSDALKGEFAFMVITEQE